MPRIILNFGKIFVEPDYYATLDDTSLSVSAPFGLLLDDYATDGDLSVLSFTQPTNGTVTVSSNGSFTYTPDPGFSGVDSFTYVAGAGPLVADGTASVVIDVYQPLLVATPDVYTVDTGDTLIVTGAQNILGNDFTNGGSIVATSFSSPSHGMLSVSLTGDITYVPDPGFVGTDSFTYYISNGYGTAFAVDTIDVVGAPPVAAPDHYTVQAGKTLLVDAATGLLANDIAFGGTVDATSFSSPSHGMLSVSITGALTYVPDPGFVGTDSFTYYISDGTETSYSVATIDVVGAPPVASPDHYTVQAGKTLLVDAATGLLANDIAFGGTVDATSFSSPSHGMLSVSITGALTYVPDPGFVGTDSFTYYISDGTETAYSVATIDVVDQAPVANPDYYHVAENRSLVVTGAQNLLGNDFVNGGTIVATSFSSPSHGMLSVSLTGDITYVPDRNYVGTDSFTYYISDGTETSYAVAYIQVGQAGVVANPDIYSDLEGQTLIVTGANNILGNDYANGGTVVATSFSSPSHGMLSVSLTGDITYVPDPGFIGLDTFTYYISNGFGTAFAIDTIDVVAPVLVATPDVYTVDPGDTLIATGAQNILGNDFTNSGSIVATSFSSPSHGMLSVSLTGDITYVPDPGFVGLDTFTYYISNGFGTAFAIDTIDVVAPVLVATPDVYTVHTGDTLIVTGAQNILGNDFTNGGSIVATSFSSPSHGMLSVSLTGDITYVPDPGFVGTDSFTYYISNGYGTAFTVDTIDVVGAPPVANPDFYTVQAGDTLLVDAQTGLLANDIAFGGTVDATSFSSPSHGMLSVSITGALTYVPDPGFVGTDSFTYYISDGTETSFATATIDVVDQAPVANPDFYYVDENGQLIVTGAHNLLGNDFTNGGSIVATSYSSPSHGMLSVSLTGDITYTPFSDYVGADSFTYYISDGTETSYAVATIEVIACFAAGTRILAERGEVPIEALGIGDRVMTLGGAMQPIKWIGRRHCTRAQIDRSPDLAPIRIRKGALSPDVPHRDLLVSPDHAIHIANTLIPARLLVNGTTVARDGRRRAITYYHLELEAHAIVLAEGLAAESYLDTGNRTAFESTGRPLMLHPDFGSAAANAARVAASCAPFATDAAVTEPLWRRLAERAVALGHTLPTTIFTDDPALRLLAASRSLAPLVAEPQAYIFAVPRSCRSVRLVSHAAAPHIGRPWLDDRRLLGVSVGRIIISDGTACIEIAVDDPALTDGWHAAERVGDRLWRWTNGNAHLPLPDGVRLLEIRLAGATDYPVEALAGVAEAASA